MVVCYSPDIPRSAFGSCPNGYYGYGSCCSRYTYSAWDSWARWVLVSGLIIFFLMLFALLCCCHSRRRRRRGATPMYGSGWMSNGQKFQMQNQPPNNYPPPPQYSAAAPPPQGQQYTGSTMQPSDGYYGQAAQYQPQQPQNVYYGGANRGTTDYAPPAGPPPGKP